MADMYLHVEHLIPVGTRDLASDDSEAKYGKGQVSFFRDAFGLRVVQYLHNKDGAAAAAGDLQSRIAAVTITDATSGTTTSVTKTGAGWTANAYKHRLLYVVDNDDTAGAAPEGEVGVIVANTATVVTIDKDRAFTVAVAASDDLSIYSLFDWDDAADGDLAINVFGVALAAVTDGNWGWLLRYGYCPDVKVKATSAFVIGDPIVADAATVGPFGTDGQELWIGFVPHTVTNDIVSDKTSLFINTLYPGGPGTAP